MRSYRIALATLVTLAMNATAQQSTTKLDAAAAGRFANLALTWRARSFYSTGAAEAELATGAELGAVQALVNGADFAEKLAE